MGRLNTTHRALIAAAAAGVFLMGMALDGLWRAAECERPGINAKPAPAAVSKVRAKLWLSSVVY